MFRAQSHLRGKERNRVLKIQISQRFEKPPGRADIQRHEFCLFCRRPLRGLARKTDGGTDYLFQLPLGKVERIRAEGVCINHVCSGVEIGKMNVANGVRVRQVPKLGAFTHGKPFRLQKRAHAAVKDQKIRFEKFGQVQRDPSRKPMNAVTDLVGIIKRVSPRVSPILRGQSKSGNMVF